MFSARIQSPLTKKKKPTVIRENILEKTTLYHNHKNRGFGNVAAHQSRKGYKPISKLPSIDASSWSDGALPIFRGLWVKRRVCPKTGRQSIAGQRHTTMRTNPLTCTQGQFGDLTSIHILNYGRKPEKPSMPGENMHTRSEKI